MRQFYQSASGCNVSRSTSYNFYLSDDEPYIVNTLPQNLPLTTGSYSLSAANRKFYGDRNINSRKQMTIFLGTATISYNEKM